MSESARRGSPNGHDGTLSEPLLTPNTVHACDVLDGLRRLDDESVDCVVTSPPYWGTRDYGVEPTTWKDGGRVVLGHERGFGSYVEHLCEVFDEVGRVLKKSGTLWLNLGDVYARSRANSTRVADRRTPESGRSMHPDPAIGPRVSCGLGVEMRSLCMIPQRVAIAMCDRGWVLRNVIVWHKPNGMPSSAKNRFTCKWEHLFFFTRTRNYHFDLDAVREPHTTIAKYALTPVRNTNPRRSLSPTGRRRPPRPGEVGAYHANGKNPGDCWSIATGRNPLAHFAVFPERLCERPILAGCPEGGLVLDPFLGSGTTAVVARRLGRMFVGFDAKPEYAALCKTRLDSQHLKGGDTPRSGTGPS